MDKLIQDITLCKRAGKLVMGFDLVKDAMQKGNAIIVLTACDLSEKTLKEITYLTSQLEVEMLPLPYTLDDLWYAVGKRAGVLCIIDEGLSEKLLKDYAAQNGLQSAAMPPN